MTTMKIRDCERLRAIIKKGQKTNEVFDRVEFGKRARIVKKALEDLDIALEPSAEMKEYAKKEADIYAHFGTRITTPDGQIGYQIEDWVPVRKALEELQSESKDALDVDKKAKEDIETIRDQEVDFDMDPMKNEWFGNFINGDDVEFLMDFDLLDLEVDSDDYKEIDRIPRKKRSRRKNISRR